MQGIRDELSGTKSAASPGDRLTGQNGWTEAEGCPLYTDDDFPRVGAAVRGLHGEEPEPRRLRADRRLPAVHPRRQPRRGRASTRTRSPSKSLALVVADTLPVQIEQMKEGLSLGQVGQRPFEMGYKTMMALRDMKDGKAAPADPTYTGLDVCTPETADTCIAK